MKMRWILFLILPLFTWPLSAALNYSKIEYPGCLENAFCQKPTGETRLAWLNLLESFNKNKISEEKLNSELQKKIGIPIAVWATEDAGELLNISLWNSPCKQHNKDASKFYIGEFFTKNIKEEVIKKFSSLYFPRAIGIDSKQKVFSLSIPRGETPLYSANGSYYFLREDDGKYYGLLVSRNGELKVTKPTSPLNLPKDTVCLKEFVDLFHREAPSPSFYQGYSCKDIWDNGTKSYRTMLFGWSCN